ncbi:hypothetical protein VP01_4184g1 [Puccinia sorghi]|uniref:Uncharacterized protein n=1 Tax=Puccinia sorghi TaxID=27349 RepID=A0A0L6UQV0_9BASI|nr:hypothetical protein VP01_4184g1 [Puccinia sorghi]
MPECLPVGDGWSAGAYTRLPISRRASELAPVTVLLLQMAGTTFEDPSTSHNRRLGRIMGQLRHRINVHSPGINIGASRIPFLFAASNLAPLLYYTTGPSDKLDQEYLRAAETMSRVFTNLVHKHETEEAPEILAIGEFSAKKYLWELLLSRVLPRLGQQIRLLTQSLHPDKLRNDPVSQLTRILDVEPALDYTLVQIFSAVAFICPDRIDIPPPTDDQHQREFKFYRLSDLKNNVNYLRVNVVSCFLHQACAIVQELDLSKTKASGQDKQQRRLVKSYLVLADDERAALNSIQATLKWLSASELDIVQDWWGQWILGFDNDLVGCMRVIARPTDQESVVPRPVIHLAKSILPLIKLTRLFFTKLTKIGMDNIQRRPVFTDMSSHQLEAYKWSPLEASHIIRGLLDALKAANASGTLEGLISHNWIRMAEELFHHLESCCRKTLQCFVSLIPVTHSSTLDQKYVTSWLVNWKILLIAANSNFVHAVRSFHHVPI